MFYCKGNEIGNGNWGNKLCGLKNIFDNDIKQVAYNKNFLVVGLPLMAQDIDELKSLMDDVKYKIYNIQFRSFNKTNTIDSVLLREINTVVKMVPIIAPVSLHNPKPRPEPEPEIMLPKSVAIPLTKPPLIKTNINIIFKIKADIQNDIYHLYCIENNMEIFYNVAYIPDYKTSVMMNKLFRNIKENENLDLLEESDDEDEFQNENVDRFVDMNKSYLMICKFNHKFKKWYPVKEFSDQTVSTIEKHAALDYEKNNYVPQQRYQNYPRHQQEKKHYNNNNNNTNNKKSYYRK
jgi:hypothetical protein